MSDTVRAFERGLQIIRCIGSSGPGVTVAQVAGATELSRATTRRFLLTLEKLGYVRQRDGCFSLTPMILDLGYTYLASFGATEMAQPLLKDLSTTVRESSSMAVLDGPDVVYVARVQANRVMTVSLDIGTRLPAYCTSMGRALMADLSPGEIRMLWESSDRSQPTERTLRTLTELRTRLATVRRDGWAMVDQELEMGVRSVAAPVRLGNGDAIAAINVSTHASRTSPAEMRDRFVPVLLTTARTLGQALEITQGG